MESVKAESSPIVSPMQNAMSSLCKVRYTVVYVLSSKYHTCQRFFFQTSLSRSITEEDGRTDMVDFLSIETGSITQAIAVESPLHRGNEGTSLISTLTNSQRSSVELSVVAFSRTK